MAEESYKVRSEVGPDNMILQESLLLAVDGAVVQVAVQDRHPDVVEEQDHNLFAT